MDPSKRYQLLSIWECTLMRILDEHINVMIPKISAKIFILRSLRSIVPIDTLKLLYNAIVLPHFDYSNIAYESASETSKLRL